MAHGLQLAALTEVRTEATYEQNFKPVETPMNLALGGFYVRLHGDTSEKARRATSTYAYLPARLSTTLVSVDKEPSQVCTMYNIICIRYCHE